MKKIIVSVVLVVMLLGSGVANAQTVSRAELEQQYKALLIQVIQLLMKQVAELQAQLAVLQAQQVSALVVQQQAPVQITTPEVVVPQVQTTSTPPVVVPPPKQYSPTIKLEIVGDYVVWQASGEPFECKLNGKLVAFEGKMSTNGQTSFNLLCVGKETGTKLQKSIQ